jgi:hypothetical protein
MVNFLSFSSSPLTRIINANYYDLESTFKVMKKLSIFTNINGFELQYLAEWQRDFPPRDNDPRYDRYRTWKDSMKYTVKELAEKINETGISILSIHGNRDIGILCCSNNSQDIQKAKKLITETCVLAEMVNARICVFHLWDTSLNNFNISTQMEIISEIANNFSNIKLSVENIPTKLQNCTPYELVKHFNWITLDLRWAVLYEELRRFFFKKKKIINIHIRGTLEGGEWKLKEAPFTVYEALDLIINEWKYEGVLTIEPEGGLVGASWQDLIEAVNSISKVI